jgi:hypothetical protein
MSTQIFIRSTIKNKSKIPVDTNISDMTSIRGSPKRRHSLFDYLYTDKHKYHSEIHRGKNPELVKFFFIIIEIILPGWRFLVGFAGVGQHSLSFIVL